MRGYRPQRFVRILANPAHRPTTMGLRPGNTWALAWALFTSGYWVWGGHEQRILSSHTPPCHRHMVIAILSSLFCLAALQHKPDQSWVWGRGGLNTCSKGVHPGSPSGALAALMAHCPAPLPHPPPLVPLLFPSPKGIQRYPQHVGGPPAAGGGVPLTDTAHQRDHTFPPWGTERRWKGGRVGGEGVWDPKVCVSKMAQPDLPDGKFCFFRRWSLWSGGGGGSRGCVT